MICKEVDRGNNMLCVVLDGERIVQNGYNKIGNSYQDTRAYFKTLYPRITISLLGWDYELATFDRCTMGEGEGATTSFTASA